MLRLPSLKERPIMNSLFQTDIRMPEPRSFDLPTLIYWVKRTPECIGILKRIATDVVTELSFTAVAEQKTGRPGKNFQENIEDKAAYFARKNLLRHKLIALVIDMLMTGDFYMWKGKLSENQLKEITLKHLREYDIELKEDIELKQFYDEDSNGVNAIELIPSSMMKIHHDNFKILKYVQEAKNTREDRIFDPDEIVHGKMMEIDGSVYGYSPMEASYVAIRTINSIQDYGYYYFENGAKVDRAWKFMGNPSETYINKFIETLNQYKGVRKAHSDLVLTGADKIEMESLNEISEEMQYRQLAIHSVGRLAFAFNMPADILSSILGVDVRGTAGGSDIEDAGYNRNIIQLQQYVEELLNSQLFLPEFKVEMSFERTFRQDQVRQIQYMAMTVPVIEFFFKHEIPVADEYFMKLLQIPRKYIIKGNIKKEIEMSQPFQMDKSKKVDGPNQQAYQQAKLKQQRPQQENNPPTGS